MFAKEEPTVNISVLVYNYAGVAPGILAGAEHQADRILNQAGVRAVWFDCSVKAGKLDEKSICRSGLGNQNIVLRLLSRHTPTRVPDFAFGFAVSPGAGQRLLRRRRTYGRTTTTQIGASASPGLPYGPRNWAPAAQFLRPLPDWGHAGRVGTDAASAIIDRTHDLHARAIKAHT